MIQKEEITKFGDLARITLSEKEKAALHKDIEAILAFVSLVKEAGGEVGKTERGDVYNVMREDGTPHEGGIYTEKLLGVVPQREGQYVKVKRILEQ